jgi:bacteriocin biosynthesis cyclodehydratase domain-containing protein
MALNRRIRRYFSIVAHSPDWAEVRYGVWNPTSFTLRDETESGMLTRLLLRLDGTAALDQIASEEGVAAHEIEALLDQLEDLGVLEDSATNALDFMLDRTPGGRLAETGETSQSPPVLVIGDGELSSQIAHLLKDAVPGLIVTTRTVQEEFSSFYRNDFVNPDEDAFAIATQLSEFAHWQDCFIIVALDTIDPHLLHRINRICHELRRPWLHAAIDGPFLFVGPLTVPFRSSCFDCFETRVMMNLRESTSYQHYKRALVHNLVKVGSLPIERTVRALLASHSAVEANNFLLTGHSCCINKVLSIYLPTMEFMYHEILRLPNCPVCAPQPEAIRQELYFDLASTLSER